MPILVKDYTWTQTESMIHIRIPLKQVKHEKVDIFTTDCYIKAHFSPFLFEVFLLHAVDNNKSKCLIKEDLIIFDLTKKENFEWESIQKELTKDEKKQMKEDMFQKCHEEAKQRSEEKSIKKSEMDRFTVQRAMDLDSRQHELMDSRRDLERKKAMDELEEWRQQAESPNQKAKIVEIDDSKAVVPYKQEIKAEIKEKGEPIINPIETKPIPSKPRNIPVRSEFVEKKKREASVRVLPRLRETGQLEIRHTQRTFPTPSRESTAEEEQAWLKNITLARRATGFISEDLRPEEQDPQWCKEKGDEFFRNGNFLGAISAYSHGITLSDKLPSLFANRSATHFALGNFNKCVNDCSAALDLMKPPCESNRRSRAKCIARRAAALARLGYLNKAIDEMKAASKLLPEDEKIKKDVYDMERAWEQNPDSD
ncbi:dynein assembly factor 4, axonemal [Manduca sexta]|uniref:dynein assembly factor 4, axonemal n=1 Tax=Manduca sexta TaxID=7130 RepID=UPI00188DD4D3|nr:dynein assembly factor 4, axonemal [Manduca sexta]